MNSGAKLNTKIQPNLNAKKNSKPPGIFYFFYTFSTFLFGFWYDGLNQNPIKEGKNARTERKTVEFSP